MTHVADEELFPLDSPIAITKFDPTPQRAHLITRDRLTETLDRQLAARLTLVTAPAGYGKTTLLAEWRKQLIERGLVVGWLSLDADDSDAPHFLRCLVLALARAGLGRAAKLASSVVMDASSAKQQLTALLNLVATEDRDVVLMFDEFEHLSDAVVRDVFAPCIERAPANLHLVVASREPPPLQIAGLRAQGLVHEVCADELRFNLAEIHSIFGEDASGGELKLLEAQTSGWPVAIQLFRGVWSRHDSRDRALHAIDTLDQTLTDYLSEQVFSALPRPLFDLLVRLSPMDRLSPGIVEFMSGSSDAWTSIIGSDTLAPFLIPHDASLEVYRAHPLIRAYFRADLDRRPASERQPILRRAAQWYAGAGRLVSALGCAGAARDATLAGQMIEDAGGLTIWLRYGLPRLRAIIDALDPAVFNACPRVRLLEAYLYVKEGKVRQSRRIFEQTRDETDGFTRDREGGSPSLLKLDSLVVETTLMVNECQTPSDAYLAEYERTILGISEDDDVFLGNVKNRLAISHCQRGDFDKSLREAAESLDHYRQAGLTQAEFFAWLHMGMAHAVKGDVARARDNYAVAREMLRSVLDGERTKQALLGAHTLDLDYERAETPLSMRRLTETMALFEQCEWWYDAFAGATVPWVMTLRATQGLEAALEAITQARTVVENRQAHGLLPLLDAVEISCLALGGDLTRARTKLEERGFSPAHFETAEADFNGGGSPWREEEAVATAIGRVLIRDGRAAEAARFLKPVTEAYKECGHQRSAIRTGLLWALALDGAGAHDDALDVLKDTAARAARVGYARAFEEEGALAAGLLDRHTPALRTFLADSGAGADFMDRLVGLVGGGAREAEKPVLSARELSVLGHVAEGLTDKEIARALDLTPNTVKFHLKNIFRKLGARNRAQAVSYGQAQSLIE